MRPISPDIEHIPAKKNKIKDLSPKRRHLKRPLSPVEKSRREISSPVPAKKKDKSDKVWTLIQFFIATFLIIWKNFRLELA